MGCGPVDLSSEGVVADWRYRSVAAVEGVPESEGDADEFVCGDDITAGVEAVDGVSQLVYTLLSGLHPRY